MLIRLGNRATRTRTLLYGGAEIVFKETTGTVTPQIVETLRRKMRSEP
ncbi:MAG: hypothetical protein M1343_12690 [Chloroflexi bacterium]|nr:hypothetical protein [Chloroflexota bacterium]